MLDWLLAGSAGHQPMCGGEFCLLAQDTSRPDGVFLVRESQEAPCPEGRFDAPKACLAV
jgi:hypothetical protein